MRQAGLGGRPAGRTSALCFGERPQRPAGPRHQPGLGSDPDSARGFSVCHLERPAGAAGRDPGCVRRSSGSRSAHACVRSPASARTPSRLQTCPCALPPPCQHSGWKQGWGAGLSPQPPGPAAPSRGLLSLAACVQGFGASLELPRGWVGGLRVPQAALGWQTRLGSRWGHPGLTPGRRVPLGHRTSVTVWTAVLWLLGRRHLLQQKRDTEVAGGQSGTSGGCPA